MSLSWSSKAIKYMLFIFNLLFVITGIILLSVGISVKAYYHDFSMFLDDSYFSAPNLLIAIGTIIFIIAFFGCCGAVKENYCMIITFSTLLILIFVLQLAAGIAGYALRNNTAEFLEDKLNASIANYRPNTSDLTTVMWDRMQRGFNCCGAVDWNDWINANSTNHEIPMSCCSDTPGAVGGVQCNEDNTHLHQKGCLQAFGDFIRGHAATIGGVGIGFACIQLLGIIFSCHLSKQIRKNYENV